MYIGNQYNKLTSVVLIPYWIAEAIQRKGLKLADVLDYDKIAPVLAVQDMANFIAFQNEISSILFTDDFGQVSPYDWDTDGLSQLWRHFTGTWQHDVSLDGVSPFETKVTPAMQMGLTKNDLRARVPANLPSPACNLAVELSWSVDRENFKARLYGNDVRLERYDHAYDLVNLAPKVVGVVVYPGFFSDTKPDLELQLELVQALLKVFYVSASYSEVAATSLFKRHLELLSGAKY